MLRYQRRMKINTPMLLFNGAGVLTIATVAGYYVSTMFAREVIPSCSGRYAQAMRLGVQMTGGKMMSPIELQSRAGLREWGVLENAKVVRVDGAPAPAVIEVKLAASKTAPSLHGAPLSGVGMTWVPPGLAGAEAACLSYDVWVPADFDFGNFGSLPGVYGGARPDVSAQPGSDKAGFNARLAWNRTGAAEPMAVIASGPNAGQSWAAAPGIDLPRNRWVHVDQEILLNKPKGQPGTYRVWIDGVLKASNMRMIWRDDDQMRIAGVHSDIVYQGAKPAQVLRLTPPVVGWR